ncbi:DNA-invertase hin [Roseovarius sp. THAF8]|uniref:recombinase family protein n=1 Tax=Roseovarius sp. THAF8 TaxID=2587846 RepID=UPI001267AAAA|nr:recombinase family protein [Roseovarius sp. THAF8]QFT97394.1 DNA-invertase hin [Roseovarius sp. THAF8]
MAENDCIEGPFIAYYRVSTKAQGKSGNGLEAQRRDIDLFLSAYACQGASVVAEYTDVASGKHDDPRRRPGLSDALAHCRRTGAVLLVSKLDRLSRKVLHIAQLMDDKTVKFKVVSMPHADEFQLQLYASLAEQERRFISLRTKAGLASVKAKGKALGGDRGGAAHAAIANRRIADNHAQNIAQIALPMRAAKSSYQAIADALTKAGVETPRGKKVWYPQTVKNALNRLNPA